MVWSRSITESEKTQLERVQKAALKIILREKYITYDEALKSSNLLSLSERREQLLLKFAIKCTQNEKTEHMFPLNTVNIKTRHSEKYNIIKARTKRLKKSAIPSRAKMLNLHHRSIHSSEF